MNWSMVLVAAGAVGNAIDRAFYGYVVDMFRTEFMNFAIFNVADIFICVGGFGLCLAILLMPSDNKKDEKDFDEDEELTVRQENVTSIKLFNAKLQPPEEVRERRRTGKLYGDKKPLDAENPFAEFEQMPTSFSRPESDLPTKEEMKAADELANKLRDEMSLESILNEFGDGTD